MAMDDPSGLDGIPASCADRATTQVDYIVVGSGPGGAPLACRLARAGMRVLVLEAGVDPGAPLPTPTTTPAEQRAAENAHLTYHCPGLHGASTEPEQYPGAKAVDTAWGFWVKHYSSEPKPATFYPRAAALGGCAVHNAMISIYGADYDWQRIADLTGDGSFSPGRMRAIYQRVENDLTGYYTTKWGRLWRCVLDFINPGRDASALRGKHGWLDITSSKPDLLLQDSRLLEIVTRTLIAEDGLWSVRGLLRLAKQAIQGKLYRNFDLNDADRMRANPEGVALVPMAVTLRGVRHGPRELLLETRRDLHQHRTPFGGELLIATGVFVRRVLFEADPQGGPPRAVGVEYEHGRGVYRATMPKPNAPSGPVGCCYSRREVILCGGAFNTPQLLMLSGIGDPAELRKHRVPEIAAGPGGATRYIDLPGVGHNLNDRCEISVISNLKNEFSMLRGTTFSPDATTDPALNAWKATTSGAAREGVYTTNGATLAILKRSHPNVIQPDLFILGFPAAFRGYYPGWSKDLFHAQKQTPNDPPTYNLWSWVILKAYTKSRGRVTLQSNDPRDAPDINFQYFKDKVPTKDCADSDVDALVSGVKFIRRLNDGAADLIASENQPGVALQDDGAIREWVGKEAWGHHACGTCRMGADRWQADPNRLTDKEAVIDSCFRVHGVRGLRVVDASAFPYIPGYFIVVPIYMLSEKAADCILNELSV